MTHAPEDTNELIADALAFAGIGFYRYTWEGRVLHMDGGAMKILGIDKRFDSPDDVIGRDISDLIIYTGKKGYLRNQLKEHGTAHNFEYQFKTLDGEERWALHDSYVRHDPNLGHEVIQVVIQDITQRKLAEIALAAERERLAVTLRSIGDGVITTDTEGRVTLLNKVAEELTGWTHAEAVGLPLRQVFHIINQRTHQTVEDPVAKVFQTGNVVGLANHTVLVARDGTHRVIADSAAPIRNPASVIVGVVLVFRDVTQKERMEEDIQRIEKLGSLGLLAGGIAHDFNNLLAAILGNVSLARLYAGQSSRAGSLLEQAEKATLRAKDLTLQLLTFSRGGDPVRKATSLPGIIQEATHFALSGSNCRAEFDLPATTYAAHADPGQISQVVHNIVLNAVQAMTDGGVVSVSCRNQAVVRGDSLPLPPGNYVSVSVADRGPGIEPDLLARVFEPYFTTKPRGSGLGLSVVHSIIVKHDGFIRATSTRGQGAVFTFWLPAAADVQEAPPEPASRPVTEGSGRVLVMDDEAAVLDMATSMLSHLGFVPETALNGREAIGKYRTAVEAGHPYDIVILDLTVPGGMGGAEAVRGILAADPGAIVVASSGYSSDPVLAKPTAFGFAGSLAKPYSVTEMSRELCRVFGKVRKPNGTGSC
jgi:PAS domain S-box-containing protein